MNTLFTTKQAADRLQLNAQTLRSWRVKGIGPKYIRFGGPMGRVAYRPADIESWLSERTFQSTSEESAARE